MNKEAEEYLAKLIKEAEGGILSSSMVLIPDRHKNTPPPLTAILSIHNEEISSVIKNSIEILEDSNMPLADKWIDFKWRLWAFFEIQDIFDSPILKSEDSNTFFNAWYFYFESKYLLTESILCGLSGFYHASPTLLRTFIEFSVLQNFHYRNNFEKISYRDFEKYLEDGIKPKWPRMLKRSLPESKFSQVTKKRINIHYERLSEISSHPHSPENSPRLLSKSSHPSPSAEGLLSFWMTCDLILQPVLWMYYTNFPMIFFPKDLPSKFGFNPPLGIFIDNSQAHIFKNSVSKNDYRKFQKQAEESEDVKSLNEWFANFKDLSESEIERTWDSKEKPYPRDKVLARVQVIARMRAIREAMSLKVGDDKENIFESMLDVDLSSFTSWEKLSKLNKRSKSRRQSKK